MSALKTYEYQGKKLTLSEWAQQPECVVDYKNLKHRMDRLWKFELALTTPKMKQGHQTPRYQLKGR